MAFPALAAPDSKQEALSDLRERIQSLQREVEQASKDSSEVSDALRKSERSISDVNRTLRNLSLKQRELSRNLQKLQQDTETTRTDIADQQKRLAELLRQRYIHGGNDAIKLMLNGQNPGDAARSLEYYSYIGRARTRLIRDYQASLARLQDLQTDVRQKQENLDQIKRERVAQKKVLESERVTRQDILYRLSSKIRRQRNEINTLVQDERRLSRLIERLARLAATRKSVKPSQAAKPGETVTAVADASLAGLDFASLKGKLALPVAGEILHRFGQGRPGGGPAWKGLFIRAREGQEVHAVGSGKVAFADWLRGFGNLLIIDHGDGFLSLYSNNESLYKQPGDPVRAGDVVATVGATGGQDEPGLYFELRRQGKPFDPMAWVR